MQHRPGPQQRATGNSVTPHSSSYRADHVKSNVQSWCRADLLFFGIESAKKARRPGIEDPLGCFQGGNGLQAPTVGSTCHARGCAICCRGRAGHALGGTSGPHVPAGTDLSQGASAQPPPKWSDTTGGNSCGKSGTICQSITMFCRETSNVQPDSETTSHSRAAMQEALLSVSDQMLSTLMRCLALPAASR